MGIQGARTQSPYTPLIETQDSFEARVCILREEKEMCSQMHSQLHAIELNSGQSLGIESQPKL